MNKQKLIQFCIIPIVMLGSTMILCFYHYVGVAISLLAVLYICLLFNLYRYWKKDNNINKLTNHISELVEEQAYNLATPIVIVHETGEIIWYNSSFSEICNTKIVTYDNLNNIIDINIVGGNDEHKVKINNNIYKVRLKTIEQDNIKYIIITFDDITEILKPSDIKENIVLIEVDNFKDVIDSTQQNNVPLLVAEIERTINSYATNRNAMIKKYDTNKYILSVQDKYVQQDIEDGFPILDEISKVNKGNKIEVTLSIGIGRGGITPLEKSNYAKVALELALGRGGDQVVIKNQECVKFFGGNTKEIEKRSRVRARVVSKALIELIHESSKIYIVGHENPDMDCFGSAVALSSVIRQLGKESFIALNKDIKAIEYYLNKLKSDPRYDGRFITIQKAIEELDNNTLVLVMDVHNRGYISGIDIVDNSRKKVVIDHHRRSPDMITGTFLSYIEVYASSTSEMVTEMVQYMVKEPDITSTEAEGLLAGMYMDTKGFSFKTGVRTFEAASYLKSLGADSIEVKKMFTDSLEDYLLIAEAIKSAEVDPDIRCAVAVCPNNVNSVIIAKAADELLNISGISVSFVLGEIDGEVYISGRSVGDINVQVVLESLGGGGHMNIAGAKLIGVTLDEAKKQLNDKIDKYLKVGE